MGLTYLLIYVYVTKLVIAESIQQGFEKNLKHLSNREYLLETVVSNNLLKYK